MSTLYELVQRTIANGHSYFAVDDNNRAYSYDDDPLPDYSNNNWRNRGHAEFIGHFDLICDWDDSFVDVTKLTLKGVQ